MGLTEALLLLRAHAFASERPLLHIARDVLAGTLRISTQRRRMGESSERLDPWSLNSD